jgi:hypothetical protein
MNIHDTPRLRAETLDALARARRLLASLEEAKQETERHLARLRRPDAYATVTGRSALDNAVASTQRLIESLERAADRLSTPEIATHAYTGGALAYSR